MGVGRGSASLGGFSHSVCYLRYYFILSSIIVQIVKSDTSITTFDGPSDIGDNGYWVANSTLSLDDYDDVEYMMICLPGSGAISFLQYASCPN